MKKSLFIAVALFTATLAFAQAKDQKGPKVQKAPEQKEQLTPEQKAENQAFRMANSLMLDDATSAKFIPIFKEYKITLKDINDKYRFKKPEGQQGNTLTDAEVEARIKANFEKSQKILDTRVAYYDKFRKVLTPKQIKKMYDTEKEQGDKAVKERYDKQHGPQGGPQAGPCPQGGPCPQAGLCPQGDCKAADGHKAH